MTKQREDTIQMVLRTLIEEKDGAVAALADVLVSAVGNISPDSATPSNLEVRQLISSLTGQLTQSKRGAISVVEALLKIDSKIAEKRSGIVPWAAKLTPLAAECALKAELDLQKESWETDQANRAPVFRLDDRTVMAVPVGEFGLEAISNFSDRVAAEVLKKRTKRVVLVLLGLDAPPGSSKYWRILKEDLESQKIRFEIVGK